MSDDKDQRIAELEAEVGRLREALLFVEWRGSRHTPSGFISGGRDCRACPECGGIAPHDGHRDWRPQDYGHRESCSVGRALVELEVAR